MRALAVVVCALLSLGVAWADEPPLALTDPGGQGLDLEKLDVRVAAHGPLALTELEMTFRNPQDRRIEGKLVCALPPGATVSRFAKEVNGELVEGEVVERLRATQVYTEILHTMQDPALLEQDQGNRFKARIFPIEAKAAVRVIISYSTVNPVDPRGRRTITVPLRGSPKIGHLKLLALCRPLPGEQVQLADASGAARPLVSKDKITFAEEMERKDFQPTEDLALNFQAGADAKPAQRLVAGDFQVAMFRPAAPEAKAAPKIARVLALVDSSASQAESGVARLQAIAKVLELLEAQHAGAAFAVEAFDISVVPLATHAKEASTALAARHFLGGTDVAKALARAGEWARAGGGPGLVVLVSDAIATFGTKETGDVVRALGAWPADATLHVLSIGSVLDSTAAAAIAEAGRGRVVSLPLNTAWEAGAKTAVEALARPRGPDFQAYDEAAEWIEPKKFPDAEAGAELITFSKRKAGAAAEVGVTAGKGTEVRAGEAIVAPEWAALLEREAYRAQLAHLERQENETADSSKRAELRKQRVKLSVEHRVLCNLTSLLVLENEGEYAKYGIDRRALADILVVGKSGIELKKREAPRVREVRKQLAPAKPMKAKKLAVRRAATRRAPAADDDDEDDARGGGEAGPVQGLEAKSEAAPMDDLSNPDPFAADGAPAPGAAPAPVPPAAEAPAPSEDAGLPSFGAAADRASAGARPAAARAQSRLDPAPRERRAEESERASDVGRLARRPASTSALGDLDERPAAPSQPVSHAPEWTRDAGSRPSKDELDALRKAVVAAPTDRGARNKLAFALNRARENRELVEQAFAWQPFDPDNPMIYEYAGDAYTHLRDGANALRAYSSIAEVSPGESGLLNRAGFMALRAGEHEMAATLFRFAIERRPDHANNYRGLAYALWSAGKFADAAKVLEDALARDYHGRYGDLPRVLREELAYVLRAWMEAEPASAARAKEIAEKAHADLSRTDDLRVTLHWETDANDVDLHIVDPNNEECYYQHKNTASGLNLYEDLTQGLGPECAVVPAGRLKKGVYHVGVTYFAAGPMGVSRGVVVIQRPGEKGKPALQIETFCLLPDTGGSGRDLRHVAVVE